MKHLLLFALCVSLGLGASAQTKPTLSLGKVATAAPTNVLGTWMYGNFSTTEYWSKSPNTYLGNAFSMALAFVFKPDGTYEQYFTSQVTNFTGATYHQSLTKGTYTVDEATRTILARPLSSHYKRTRGGVTHEDRDMRPDELANTDAYTYAVGTEPNGAKALYLAIKGKTNALTFLRKD